MSKIKLLLDVVEDLRTLATSIETLAAAVSDQDNTPEAPPAPASPPQPTTSEPKLTIVELRAFVAERSTPENRPKIKAIHGKFGVNKLTELPEEKYGAVKQEVAAL